FLFSSRRRHTRSKRDWSSDVCSSDLARTGYTGEDGFELMIYNADATKLWQLFSDHDDVTPCGLASRDSLRLEAGMPLYGNELSQIGRASCRERGDSKARETTVRSIHD